MAAETTSDPQPHPTPGSENEVTTGFGVDSTDLEAENPKQIRSASACEAFREAIELGAEPRSGCRRNSARSRRPKWIRQQTVKRYVPSCAETSD
jgi:hypothetical protein